MPPAVDQGQAASARRYQLVPRVLCFVEHERQVLLLKGAPDKKIWAGKYNGLGGHVERGESIHAAARREIREEAGLEVEDLRLRGVVTVDAGHADQGIAVFVFSARATRREVTASGEGSLRWVDLDTLGALDTVEDLPELLSRTAGQPAATPAFSAQYHYDENGRLRMAFEGETAELSILPNGPE